MSFWKKLFSRQDRPRAEKLLERGFIHARKGRLKEALVAYEQSAAADESFAHAWLNQGLTLQDQYNARAGKMTAEEAAERLDAIADRFERAVECDVGLYLAWRCLGHVSRRLQRYARAETCFDAVVQYAPPDFEHRKEALDQLAAVRWRAQKQRTLDEIQALAADADSPAASLRSALDAFEALSAQKPEATAEQDETFQADGLALIAGEHEPSAWTMGTAEQWAIATLQRRLGLLDDARASLGAVLEHDPRHIGAHRDLATLALDAEKYEEALLHSLAAYQEDPVNAGLVCNVGVCHFSLGHLDEAGEFFEMAVNLDPKDPIVLRAHATWKTASEQSQDLTDG